LVIHKSHPRNVPLQGVEPRSSRTVVFCAISCATATSNLFPSSSFTLCRSPLEISHYIVKTCKTSLLPSLIFLRNAHRAMFDTFSESFLLSELVSISSTLNVQIFHMQVLRAASSSYVLALMNVQKHIRT